MNCTSKISISKRTLGACKVSKISRKANVIRWYVREYVPISIRRTGDKYHTISHPHIFPESMYMHYYVARRSILGHRYPIFRISTIEDYIS